MISPQELRRQLADLAERLPPASNDVLQAVGRRYRRRRLIRAAAMMTVVGLTVTLLAVYAPWGQKPRLVQVGSGSDQPRGGNQSCQLPALPFPGGGQFPFAGQPLTGPAPQALQGGEALSAFTLDSGAFQLSLPRHGDKPKISAIEAECAALASLTPNGSGLVYLASGSGVAVGYGRVTISRQLVASAKPDGPFGTGNTTPSPPRLPSATPYVDRLAWIVVVGQARPIYSGGPGTAAPSAPHETLPSAFLDDYNYEIFVVDAITGSAALLYAEPTTTAISGGGTPSPTVVVPAEQFSVAWTLTSRSPNRYSATISATVEACDGYPSTVNADPDDLSAAVIVYRPVGTKCSDRSPVAIALHAPTVTSDLPATINHDPLGPYISPVLPQHPATTPGRTLRSLGPEDSGSTIYLSVGSVVVVSGLLANQSATSSSPQVLGPLGGSQSDQGFGGEFRAWMTGQATLTVPTSACDSTNKTVPPCSGPWIIHIEVP